MSVHSVPIKVVRLWSWVICMVCCTSKFNYERRGGSQQTNQITNTLCTYWHAFWVYKEHQEMMLEEKQVNSALTWHNLIPSTVTKSSYIWRNGIAESRDIQVCLPWVDSAQQLPSFGISSHSHLRCKIILVAPPLHQHLVLAVFLMGSWILSGASQGRESSQSLFIPMGSLCQCSYAVLDPRFPFLCLVLLPPYNSPSSLIFFL